MTNVPIEKKVTARTGAAGVLVGALLVLGVFAFVDRHDAAKPVGGSKISAEESSTTASSAVVPVEPTSSAAPADTPTTVAPGPVPTTAAPSIDQRVTHLEQRVDTIEETTTTTATTIPPSPPTTAEPIDTSSCDHVDC